MEIGEALYPYLTGGQDLAADVAALVGDRVYPLWLPQSPTYPALCYRTISTQQPMCHDGPVDLETRRVQFDGYAENFAEVNALARALRKALNGFRGDMAGLDVQSCLLESVIDDWGDAAGVWRVTVDFTMMYRLTT
jgi:hypothetical protein